MILLDLKLALFVVLLGVCGGIGGAWWFRQRRAPVASDRERTVDHILETLPVGILILDHHGTIAFANRLALRLLQTQNGAALADVVHRFLDDPSAATSARSGIWPEPVPLRWWRSPLDDRRILAVLADWGDWQRLAREHQAFVGLLSHELRTPLTALVTHAEVLRNDATSEAVRRSSIEIVQREAQRMGRLVRDLVELHRLEMAGDLPLEPVDLVVLVEDVIAQLILPAEQQGLRLSFDADAIPEPVLARPDRIKQVFLNLLDNAIKYSRPGDAIRVRLEARRDGVVCIIQDTGPGIPAKHLPHVMERLYRGRTDVEGSGIGLALVDEILRRHDATLTVESATEGSATGTTLRWMLPYATVTADN